MSDTSKQLFESVLAEPRDLEARSIYCDYLLDKGDPEGTYLQLEMELSKLDRGAKEAKAKRSQLTKVMASVDLKWLKRFQQPDLMLTNPTRFPQYWVSNGLSYDVVVQGTYGRFEYSEIANVANEGFGGQLEWLKEVPPRRVSSDETIKYRAKALDELVVNAKAKNVVVPKSVLLFLQDDANLTKIPSITDCYFEFQSDLVRAPGDEGWFLLLLSDSQGCCHWYLYLDDFGGASVSFAFDFFSSEEEADEEEPEDLEEPQHPEHVYFCAPDFETFAYRLWCENNIWLNQYWRESSRWEKPELDQPMRDYLAHYKANTVSEVPWLWSES